MIPAHRRTGAVLVVASIVGACTMMQSWGIRSTWVDRAFIPIRYAFSFSTGEGGRLPGQEGATMGFLDPLWVALLTAVHGAGFQPVNALPLLGTVCAGIAAACIAGDAWRRYGTVRCLLPVAAFVASTPLLVASRSGANDVWLGCWTVVALVCAGRDLDAGRCGWLTRLSVFGLALTGPFGVVASLGVMWCGFRKIGFSILLAVVAQLLLAYAYGIESATALWVDLQRLDVTRIAAVTQDVPVLIALGAVGLFWRGTGDPIIRFGLWCAGVWGFRGVSGIEDAGAMADRFVPALLVVVWWSAIVFVRSRRLGLFVWAVALVSVDVYGSRAGLEGISSERRVTLKESQVMARFLKWRFTPRETVALHSPGSIAYHYGGPVIDASGRTEVRDVSPLAVLKMNPAAMVPAESYVGQSVTFTPMFNGYTNAVHLQYDRHSVQHQRKWGLTKANPVFFQYLTRKTLPRLPEHISEEDGNRFPKQ